MHGGVLTDGGLGVLAFTSGSSSDSVPELSSSDSKMRKIYKKYHLILHNT